MTSTPVMRLTAGAPLPVLVGALARAAWIGLDQRAAQGVRAVLQGLATVLPPGSATGRATVAQVADASGRSVRRTRQVLQTMEAAGMIRWTRGDLLAGGRRPSLFRVDKRLLVALIRHARRELPARLAARTAEFLQRLASTLRQATVLRQARAVRRAAGRVSAPDSRRDAQSHGEIKTALPPSRGRERGSLRLTPRRFESGLAVPGTMAGKPRPRLGPGSRAEQARQLAAARGIELLRC